MIKEITIPEIGENVESGEVIKVLVSQGDMVEEDQGIIELETEKAVVEIPSPDGGKITEITVSEGDSVKIGQTIGKIETEGEEGAEEEAEEKEPEEAEEPEEETEEKPEDEEEKVEAKEEKEEVKEEPEKEKSKPEKKLPEAKPQKSPQKKEPEEKAPGKDVAPAAPSVRRLARELGADISKIAGSGPGGRITQDDVKHYIKRIVSGETSPAAGVKQTETGAPTLDMPDFSQWGEISREPLTRVRSIIAQGTSATWNTIPHVTQFDRADITELETFRKKYGKKAEDAGGKLTVTAILMKVLVSALKQFPRFNASIDLHSAQIIYKYYYHLGIAVDTERGLLVPVIRDVDQKSILDLSVELKELADKTRGRKISPDELEGGTFTISNQGGIGGTDFTPIVYWPQVAILGVSRASVEPVFMDGEFKPRKILPLSMSYDHRIIDGADAARFLRWVKEALEHPFLINFEV